MLDRRRERIVSEERGEGGEKKDGGKKEGGERETNSQIDKINKKEKGMRLSKEGSEERTETAV